MEKKLTPRELVDQQAKFRMNKEHLFQTIEEFEKDLEEDVLRDRITISGKTLSKALTEQTGWTLYYNIRKSKLKTLIQKVDSELERIYAVYFSYYHESNARAATPTAIAHFIKNESAYNSVVNLKLEVEGMQHLYSAVCETLTSRGFQLRDLTSARVHEVQNYIIE
jgi:hypothetical protein